MSVPSTFNSTSGDGLPDPHIADMHALHEAMESLHDVGICPTCGRPCTTSEDDVALLRRVLAEYLQHNQIIDGHWYSPDENGEAHNDNGPAGPDELALIESVRQEYGL